jgi:organic hydroperoxide reductase OsmC/OhrA
LVLAQYRSRAEGILEKTREGIVFTRITLHVEIQAPPQRLEEARKMVDTAKRYCIVSNALKLPVEVDAAIAPSGSIMSDAGAA